MLQKIMKLKSILKILCEKQKKTKKNKKKTKNKKKMNNEKEKDFGFILISAVFDFYIDVFDYLSENKNFQNAEKNEIFEKMTKILSDSKRKIDKISIQDVSLLIKNCDAKFEGFEFGLSTFRNKESKEKILSKFQKLKELEENILSFNNLWDKLSCDNFPFSKKDDENFLKNICEIENKIKQFFSDKILN